MANDALEKLVLQIGMDVAAIREGSEQARGDLGALEKKAKETQSVFSELFKFELLKRGVAALQDFLHSGAEFVEKMDNLADAAGVSVERFSGLAYAARQVGVDAEQLSGGMTRLSHNMASAAFGGQEAQRAFKLLGIDVRDAGGHLRDPNIVLGEIAKKFSEMPDSATKSALAVSFFGKQGAQLVPLLNLGPQAMDAFAAAAKRLGITLNEDLVRGAREYQNQLRRLTDASTIFSANLASQLVPTLKQMLDSLFNTTDAMGSLGQKTEYVVTFFKILGTTAFVVKGLFESIGVAIAGLGSAAVSFIQSGIDRPLSPIQNLKNLLIDLGHTAEDTFDSKKLRESLDALWKPAAVAAAVPGTGTGETPVFDNNAANKAREFLDRVVEEYRRKTAELASGVKDEMDELNHRIFATGGDINDKLREVFGAHWVVTARPFISMLREVGQAYVDAAKHAEQLKASNEAAGHFAGAIEELREKLARFSEASNEAATKQSLMDGKLAEWRRQMKGFVSENELGYASDLLLSYAQAVDRAKDAQEAAAKTLAEHNRIMQDAHAGFERTLTPLEKYLEKQVQLGKAYREGVISADEFKDATEAARAAFGHDMDKMAKDAERFGSAVFDAFEENMGKPFDEMLHSMLNSFLKTLARMLAEAAAANFAKAFLGTTVGQSLYAFATGTALNFAQPGSIQEAKAIGRASGGPVGVNRSYLVGENGPELFVPQTSGHIVNARDTAALSAASHPSVMRVSLDRAALGMRVSDWLDEAIANELAHR